jgi:hypothetical protein
MIGNAAKLKRLVLGMIREHAPMVAAGQGVAVRKTGRTFEVSLHPINVAKLAALEEPVIASGSGAAANMGPPPPVQPPPVLGP